MDKIIYKRTSAGAIQQWQQEIEGDKYRTISGQVDGKLVTSEWTVCKGKNTGKKNETSPKEQAKKEVAANYKKKLDQKGYHEDIKDIDKAKFFKPMLAQEYKGKVEFPVYVQPKLDGIRCICTKDGMFTRNGKSIVSCPHIFEELKPYFVFYAQNKLDVPAFAKSNNEMIFDGEIYNHDFKHDFNTIISLARKTKPTEEDLKESAEKIEYHIYDYPKNWPFSQRAFLLQELNKHKFSKVKFVDTQKIDNETLLDSVYSEYLNNGYEGQMIRLDKPYENKRSKNLLKRKPNHSDEFELVNIESGVGNYAGIAKIATLKLPDGRLFGAGIAGSQDRNRQILKNRDKYIGLQTTVEYIGLTPDGIPRFGRVKEFNRDG